MATSYTSLLGLALPVTGELSGTWGDTVNNYITSYLDSAIAGAQVISGSQTAVTLSKTTNASLSQAGSGATGSSQYQIINCTGNPASLLTITAPAANKVYVVINATSTSQSVKVVGVGPTTGVTMVSGEKAVISWNGSDFVKVASSVADGVTTIDFGTTGLTPATATSGAVTVAGTLAVANGGTGQTSFTNGQLLIGNTTGNTLTKATLNAGSNITITNGPGSIQISSSNPGGTVTSVSGTGTVQGLTLSGTVTSTGSLTLGGSLSAVSLTSQVSGTLPVANGGTNLISFTTNGVLYAPSTSALATAPALTFNGSTLTVNSVSVGRGGSAVSTNTAIGDAALVANTSGANNTAVGSSALAANTGGGNNTAIGFSALGANTSGAYNTAVGYRAALSTLSLGLYNTVVGADAGYTMTAASNNVLLGDNAGYLVTTDKNTFIGSSSGTSMTTGAKNTILGRYSGNQSSLDIRTLNNCIVLSDGDGLPRAYFSSSTNSWVFQTGSWPGAKVTTMGSSGQFVPGGAAATTPVVVSFSATAMSIDCLTSNVFTTTFTANVTTAPTLSSPLDGQTINWFITQDGTGSRTMTWPTSFKWPGGTAGVLSTAANSVDLLTATYRSATGFWYATLLKAFS